VALAADAGARAARPERRTAVVGGCPTEIDVHPGPPPPGTTIDGPAVVHLPESTLLVGAGWAASAQPTGTIAVQRR
jgi:hypothetical protein